MGKEFKVSSIEEMCALMCDNRLPADKPRKRKPRKDQGFKKLLDDKMKKLWNCICDQNGINQSRRDFLRYPFLMIVR